MFFRLARIIAATLLLTANAGQAYQIEAEQPAISGKQVSSTGMTARGPVPAIFSRFGTKAVASAGTVLVENFDTNAILPANWGASIIQGSTQGWLRVTSGAQPACTPLGTGMAMFSSYAMSSGDSTRLYSPVFSLSGQTAPVLEFRMYHDTGFPTNTDRIGVEISTDGGAGYAPPLATIARYDGSNGWKVHTVDLAAYIGQTSVRIAFLGISGFGHNMYIDTVRIGAPTTFYKTFLPLLAKPGPPSSDGNWSGTTSRGQPMSFQVSDTGTTWQNFNLKTDFVIGDCIGTLEFGASGPGAITGNQFSYNGGVFSFAGQLNSATTASGTYTITNQTISTCGTLNQTGTWSALLP